MNNFTTLKGFITALWTSIIILLSSNITTAIVDEGIDIHSNAVVHFVVIDPLGRKTGFDPVRDQWFEEIPGANYGNFGVDDHEVLDAKVEYIREFGTNADNPPIQGQYKIKVIGISRGKYSIGIYFLRGQKSFTTQIVGVADSGSVSYYQFTYNSNPDSAITLERVVNSCSDLRQDLDLCYKIGLITNKGIYNSLSKKIDNAEKAVNKGKLKEATNHLNAFINEVEAQSGKHITDDAGVILIDDAGALIKKW